MLSPAGRTRRIWVATGRTAPGCPQPLCRLRRGSHSSHGSPGLRYRVWARHSSRRTLCCRRPPLLRPWSLASSRFRNWWALHPSTETSVMLSRDGTGAPAANRACVCGFGGMCMCGCGCGSRHTMLHSRCCLWCFAQTAEVRGRRAVRLRADAGHLRAGTRLRSARHARRPHLHRRRR